MQTHRAFFEELAPRWDSMRTPARMNRLHQLLDRFKLTWQSAQSILDVGTGTGLLLPILHQRAPQARLAAIDLAGAMLSRARLRREQAHLAQADAQRLPFAPGAFDVVLCHAVLPHLSNQPAALTGFHRILSPGGVLLVLHEISRAEVNAIHQQVGGAIHADRVPLAGQLQRWLEAAGYRVILADDSPRHYLVVAQTAP